MIFAPGPLRQVNPPLGLCFMQQIFWEIIIIASCNTKFQAVNIKNLDISASTQHSAYHPPDGQANALNTAVVAH